MAYLLHAERVQRVAIYARILNVDVVNILDYTVDPGPGWGTNQPNSTQLMDEVSDQFLAAFRPLISTSMSYLKVTAKEIQGWNPALGPPPVEIVPFISAQDELSLIGISGLKAGDGLPTYVSVTAQKKTNSPGRRFRGRTSFAGIVEGDTEGNNFNFLTAAAFASWTNAWALFRAAVITLAPGAVPSNVSMSVLSLKELSLAGPPNTPMNTVSSSRKVVAGPVNGYVGSQLSRKFRQPG